MRSGRAYTATARYCASRQTRPEGADVAKRTRPRVLIIRLGAVGDVVNVASAASILRDHYPDARIVWLVQDTASEVVDLFEDVDDKVVFERRRWVRDVRRLSTVFEVVREVGRFLSMLRRPRFDVSLDFQGDLKSGVLGLLANAKQRVGFAEGFCREGNDLFTDFRYAPSQSRVRRPDRHLALLRHFGIDSESRLPRARVAAWAEREVGEFLRGHVSDGRRIVAIHPGTSPFAAFKRWPAEKYALLADRLAKDLGCAVVFTWGPGELETVQSIVGMMTSPALALPPAPSLMKTAALLRRCALCIGGDTGPLHLAAALGAPVLGIYGPKDTGLYAPSGSRHILVRSGLGCGPCTRRRCPGSPCMRSIRVETVLDAAHALLDGDDAVRTAAVPSVRVEEAAFHRIARPAIGRAPYELRDRGDGLWAFAGGRFRGLVDSSAGHHELLARLADPSSFFSTSGSDWLINRARSKVCSVSLRVEFGQERVHVKRYLRRGSFRLHSRRMRPSQARHAWRAARSLRAAGLSVPRPLAFVERGPALFPRESALVTEGVPDARNARELLDAHDVPHNARLRLIALAARCVAEFHLAGHVHGSLGAKSILIQCPQGASPKAWLLDLELARRLRFVPASCRDLWRSRDLRMLNDSLHDLASGRDRGRFLILYARRLGWSRRRARTLGYLITRLSKTPGIRMQSKAAP